jgi:hypothetical protein
MLGSHITAVVSMAKTVETLHHRLAVEEALQQFKIEGNEPMWNCKVFLTHVVVNMSRKFDPEAIEACRLSVNGSGLGFVEQVYKDLKDVAKMNSTGTAATLVAIPFMIWSVCWTRVEMEADRRGGASEAQLMAKMMTGLGVTSSARALTERLDVKQAEAYSSVSKSAQAKGSSAAGFGFSTQALKNVFSQL